MGSIMQVQQFHHPEKVPNRKDNGRSARLSSMSNYKGLTAGSAWIAGFAGLGWLLSGLLNGWLITRPTFLPVPFVQLLFPETIALATWRTVGHLARIHCPCFRRSR